MEWDESKHKRGQPDNAGQFAPSSGTARSKGDKEKTKEAIRKYSDDPERDIAEYGGLESKQKIIKLPKNEYAELCSVIRTRYADKIPAVGRILNGNYLYLFRYDSGGERIACTFKIPITGNENIISELME